MAIRFASPVVRLLEPARIGGRDVANRFVIHPMEGCDGNLDGTAGELTERRWTRFGAGGAAVLWGEATAVRPDGRANTRQLVLTDKTAGSIEQLVRAAKDARRRAWGDERGFLVGIQLTHSGRWSSPPAALLEEDDLDELTSCYVGAAVLAARIGADFVDVKQCHGYLLNDLLAGRGSGRYGGDLEGRTRFVRTVVEGIRAEAPSLLVATRINVFDGAQRPPSPAAGAGFGCRGSDPEQPDLREPVEVIRMLADAGVGLVNVTAGCPYTNPHIGRPADRPPVDGYAAPEPGLEGVARHFELAAGVQRALPELPVVGTGYSYLRQFFAEAGEANLADGRVSLVGVGRGAIAYPDFVADLVVDGCLDTRKVCMTVSQCTTLMRSKNNDLGQYASGCVPRDPVYARILQEARRSR